MKSPIGRFVVKLYFYIDTITRYSFRVTDFYKYYVCQNLFKILCMKRTCQYEHTLVKIDDSK